MKSTTMILIAGLLLLSVAAVPVMAHPMINQGDTVYVGEHGLDLTNAINHYPMDEQGAIGWWASWQDPTVFQPAKQILLQTSRVVTNFGITKAGFTTPRYGNALGNWYIIRSDGTANTTDGAFFVVEQHGYGAR